MSKWAQFQVAMVFVNDLLAILDEFGFCTTTRGTRKTRQCP